MPDTGSVEFGDFVPYEFDAYFRHRGKRGRDIIAGPEGWN